MADAGAFGEASLTRRVSITRYFSECGAGSTWQQGLVRQIGAGDWESYKTRWKSQQRIRGGSVGSAGFQAEVA